MGVLFSRVRLFMIQHERLLSCGGLVLGFLFDALFFKRVDLPFENFGILMHFVVGFLAIALMHVRQSWYSRHHILEKFRLFLPFVMQFAIGGLFGKFLIFYSKSGALVQSWPFLVMLVVLFIGNESFRGRYEKLNFRLAIFFTAFFSYGIFSVPILLHEISDRSFLISGIVSLLLMFVIIRMLHRFIENIPWGEHMSTYGTILAIYIAFNLMYFTNIIPPLPLALKDSGVYHSVVRTLDGSYAVQAEGESWYAKLFGRSTLHVVAGSPTYAYSSIFAPTLIGTDIVHEWQYYDDVPNEWVTKQRVELPISGGRDGGYRTYSYHTIREAGSWRVDVETPRGQLIGRLNFDVIETAKEPQLLTKLLQ